MAETRTAAENWEVPEFCERGGTGLSPIWGGGGRGHQTIRRDGLEITSVDVGKEIPIAMGSESGTWIEWFEERQAPLESEAEAEAEDPVGYVQSALPGQLGLAPIFDTTS